MEAPPLTLSVLHLRPSSLLIPGDEPSPPASALPSDPQPPSHPLPVFSPTHAYPAPHPTCTLGSTLALSLDLANTSSHPVQGVRMMCEIQSPAGRFRLGEAIHGLEEGAEETVDTPLKELGPGESVRLDVEGEVKDLGVTVIIVSAAWETVDGRRTLQRFFKYNVNPPLAIKTRIHQTQHPNTALDLEFRENIYLEIVATNVSSEGMLFDKVFLEPVHGLTSTLTSSGAISDESGEGSKASKSNAEAEVAGEKKTLLPGETRQYLFLLSPTPPDDAAVDKPEDDNGDSPATRQSPLTAARSSFPPHHTPGMILPIGRLDLTWRSGPCHDPGRLQTSTLNRRIPVHQPSGPSRTLSATSAGISRSSSPRPGLRTPGTDGLWEFDLAVLDRPKNVGVETDFEVTLRIGVRTANIVEEGDEGDPTMPPLPVIGVQYLSQPLMAARPQLVTTGKNGPNFTLSPPSRSNTPVPPSASMARTGSATSTTSRPFSPLHAAAQPSTPSRAMTPVSSQLRQATSSHLNSPSVVSLPLGASTAPEHAVHFPPSPIPSMRPLPPKAGDLRGEAQHLGVSLTPVQVEKLDMVEERSDTTYADPISPLRRWETTFEHKLRFIAMDEGLAELGGLRLLVLDDQRGMAGSIGREWESLGEVWISD